MVDPHSSAQVAKHHLSLAVRRVKKNNQKFSLPAGRFRADENFRFHDFYGYIVLVIFGGEHNENHSQVAFPEHTDDSAHIRGSRSCEQPQDDQGVGAARATSFDSDKHKVTARRGVS